MSGNPARTTGSIRHVDPSGRPVMTSLIRYLREYGRPSDGAIRESAEVYDRDGEMLEATVYRPSGRTSKLPGWVVLHGLTAPGRRHPALIRFARAVAASGTVVLVPDVPEWRDLRIDTAVAAATIRAAVRALQMRDDVAHAHAGLLGFSFGATQALIAAADPEVDALLSGIAAWGGYADVRRLFRFGLTGTHELDGERYSAVPDPYGRWISVGQYLTATPGYEDATDVSAAVRALALEAGRLRVYAGDPALDRLKVSLRGGIAPQRLGLYDALAHPADRPPADTETMRSLASALADAALRVDPMLDPTPFLSRITTPVLLAHGLDDRLIPFTESLRLQRALPPGVVRRVEVTALFAHSGGTREGLGPTGYVREAVRFASLLRAVLSLP